MSKAIRKEINMYEKISSKVQKLNITVLIQGHNNQEIMIKVLL